MGQNRIREHRERLDWSQERLAEKAGTSGQQISRLENSQRRLSDGWLEKLASAMGIRKRDLLVENGERRQHLAGDGLDDIELWLLGLWRDLTPEEQKVVLSMVRGWATKVLDDQAAIQRLPPESRRER